MAEDRSCPQCGAGKLGEFHECDPVRRIDYQAQLGARSFDAQWAAWLSSEEGVKAQKTAKWERQNDEAGQQPPPEA